MSTDVLREMSGPLAEQEDAFAAVLEQRDRARGIAVALEQELDVLRYQLAAATAAAEQLGCVCEFIPDHGPCRYCEVRAYLAAPPDALTLDVIEQRRREDAADETAALRAEGEAELAESGADYADDFYREVGATGEAEK